MNWNRNSSLSLSFFDLINNKKTQILGPLSLDDMVWLLMAKRERSLSWVVAWPRCAAVSTGSHSLSRSLLSFLSLHSIAFSGRGNQELRMVVGWVKSNSVWVFEKPAWGTRSEPLFLALLLSCSTSVVRMSFSPIS